MYTKFYTRLSSILDEADNISAATPTPAAEPQVLKTITLTGPSEEAEGQDDVITITIYRDRDADSPIVVRAVLQDGTVWDEEGFETVRDGVAQFKKWIQAWRVMFRENTKNIRIAHIGALKEAVADWHGDDKRLARLIMRAIATGRTSDAINALDTLHLI